MRNMQLYATGAATATSVAQVVIPSAATVRGVHLMVQLDGTADNGSVRLEFSKVPTNQIGVNGAQDPFLEVGLYNNNAANGTTLTAINQFFPLDVQCRQGETIYLHATVAGVTYFVNAIFSY